MSNTKRLTNISTKQITDKGVQALANRPNATAQYGAGGLSPAQLKLWFDKLATFLAEKVNELQNTLCAPEAAEYVRILLDEHEVNNLSDLVKSFGDGTFASKILQVQPSAAGFHTLPLQTAINTMAKTLSEQEDSVGNLVKKVEDVYGYMIGIREKIYSLQEAPPISVLSDTIVLCTPTLGQLAALS